MLSSCSLACSIAAVALFALGASADETGRDYTCFQSGSGYRPKIDVATDVAIVYGVGGDFPERADSWRRQGYAVSLMTGIAWGGYGAYYGAGDGFKKDEVQTAKSGRLFMHGQSTTVGYNVPTPAYVDFIKAYVKPALDHGVGAVYLEEPEYWAQTGWSEGFKQAWQRFYGEPWQPPDSSVDAQYRASKLKYELYYEALRDVFAHVDARAAANGRAIECHVPTHSLINYAQWRIVSPESHLIDIPQLDGYIAQVWTGTARSQNAYRGVTKERTFETAFLEYGQMLGMVRPTGKKVWFLADPIEDNPDHSWNDYKRNYECTLVASLLWPEVHRFEVMPWPGRIFQGQYPKVDLETKTGAREGIPADYATQVLACINALNEMDQAEVVYDTGSRGIGVLVSDTLMFQRAGPHQSDARLGSFYGLALPFVENGVPVEVVQLENTTHPACLPPYKLLLLTYEGQKPLKPAYHDALAAWVRSGGGLIYVGDGTDPYHGVREWWNDDGRTDARACDDLFARLGVTDQARKGPQAIGEGFVRVLWEKPRDLPQRTDGADTVLALAQEMFARLGGELRTQNYLRIQRGPFVVAGVLEESSVSGGPLRLEGRLVDLFDAKLPVVAEKVLEAGDRALLYDVDWAQRHALGPKVLAAAARVRDESAGTDAFTFTARGPEGTRACARLLLPQRPSAVETDPPMACEQAWDQRSSTLWLAFDNVAAEVRFRVAY